MSKKQKNAISPARAEDYPEWYQQVIKASDMAERSPVRGCMVIKPWGYALWENIVAQMDRMFKATGVKNAYFPLFIPVNFLEKEAERIIAALPTMIPGKQRNRTVKVPYSIPITFKLL